MKATNAFFMAGMLTAALGMGAIYATKGSSEDAPAPTPQAEENKAQAAVTPLPSSGQGISTDYTKYQSHSMYVDVLRSSHIAIGQVTAAQYPAARVELTFQPLEYLHGTPLTQTSVQIKTETNGDLRDLIGQTVVIAFLEGNWNGQVVYGAAHGTQSITPESKDVDASVDFYTSMLDIKNRYADGVAEALAINPDDGRFPFPAGFVEETKDLLVATFAKSGSKAAHHAGRVLLNDPVFTDVLNGNDLIKIADAVRSSNPQTFDRGYGIKILNENNAPLLTIDDAMAMVRDEVALINIDHLAAYMVNHIPNGLVVPALAEIFKNESLEETPQAIRNALEAAWQLGDSLVLPYFDEVLGTLETRDQQRALLKGYAGIHHPRNLEPLIIYMNGGLPSEVHGSIANLGEAKGVDFDKSHQSDCKDSNNIMKHTILAIAMIDSEASNMLIRQMHATAKTQWLRDFAEGLREENKEWRSKHILLREGDRASSLGSE